MIYKYELRDLSNRNNTNLLHHTLPITTTLNTLFHSNLISIKVHQKYFEFETTNEISNSEKQRIGKTIAIHDPILNSIKINSSLFFEKETTL